MSDALLTPAMRPYQWLLRLGARASTLFIPSPRRLGTPAAEPDQEQARRAEPVVLVGGYASTHRSMQAIAASLRADGFQHVFVFVVPENGLADINVSSRRLGAFIEDVRRRTGAGRVSLVAHSAGGVVSRVWAQLQGGAGRLGRLVTIATPHHGVVLWRLPVLNAIAGSRLGRATLGPATAQLLEGSQLLRELDLTRERLDGRLTSIFVDGFDGLLAPDDTAIVEGARNVRMVHPGQSLRQARLGHFTLHRRSGLVYELVRRELLGSA